MSYAQWNSFTNYRVADEVQNGSSTVYACILANTNEPPPNATFWNALVPPAGGGITSVEGLTIADNGGNIVFSSAMADFTTTPSTGTINVDVNFPAAVNQLNTVDGSVELQSPSGALTFEIDGQNINVALKYFVVVPTAQETEITISVPGMTSAGKAIAQWEDTNILVNPVVSAIAYSTDQIIVYPAAYPVLPSPTIQYFDTTSRITVFILSFD
jgi:hypothetical protein